MVINIKKTIESTLGTTSVSYFLIFHNSVSVLQIRCEPSHSHADIPLHFNPHYDDGSGYVVPTLQKGE